MKQIKLSIPYHHLSRTNPRPRAADWRSPSWTTRRLGFCPRRGPAGKRCSLCRFPETSQLFCCSQGRWGWRSRQTFYCAPQQCVVLCVRISAPANKHKSTLKNYAPHLYSLKLKCLNTTNDTFHSALALKICHVQEWCCNYFTFHEFMTKHCLFNLLIFL